MAILTTISYLEVVGRGAEELELEDARTATAVLEDGRAWVVVTGLDVLDEGAAVLVCTTLYCV